MRPMVSIIVPVYNAEQYLRRCVDSILNQEYTDFEVFLVNDGSTESPTAEIWHWIVHGENICNS